MQFSSVFLAAAMLFSGAMADCWSECPRMINACCARNGQACADLDNCGANWITSACSNPTSACSSYCITGSSSCLASKSW